MSVITDVEHAAKKPDSSQIPALAPTAVVVATTHAARTAVNTEVPSTPKQGFWSKHKVTILRVGAVVAAGGITLGVTALTGGMNLVAAAIAMIAVGIFSGVPGAVVRHVLRAEAEKDALGLAQLNKDIEGVSQLTDMLIQDQGTLAEQQRRFATLQKQHSDQMELLGQFNQALGKNLGLCQELETREKDLTKSLAVLRLKHKALSTELEENKKSSLVSRIFGNPKARHAELLATIDDLNKQLEHQEKELQTVQKQLSELSANKQVARIRERRKLIMVQIDNLEQQMAALYRELQGASALASNDLQSWWENRELSYGDLIEAIPEKIIKREDALRQRILTTKDWYQQLVKQYTMPPQNLRSNWSEVSLESSNQLIASCQQLTAIRDTLNAVRDMDLDSLLPEVSQRAFYSHIFRRASTLAEQFAEPHAVRPGPLLLLGNSEQSSADSPSSSSTTSLSTASSLLSPSSPSSASSLQSANSFLSTSSQLSPTSPSSVSSLQSADSFSSTSSQLSPTSPSSSSSPSLASANSKRRKGQPLNEVLRGDYDRVISTVPKRVSMAPAKLPEAEAYLLPQTLKQVQSLEANLDLVMQQVQKPMASLNRLKTWREKFAKELEKLGNPNLLTHMAKWRWLNILDVQGLSDEDRILCELLKNCWSARESLEGLQKESDQLSKRLDETRLQTDAVKKLIESNRSRHKALTEQMEEQQLHTRQSYLEEDLDTQTMQQEIGMPFSTRSVLEQQDRETQANVLQELQQLEADYSKLLRDQSGLKAAYTLAQKEHATKQEQIQEAVTNFYSLLEEANTNLKAITQELAIQQGALVQRLRPIVDSCNEMTTKVRSEISGQTTGMLVDPEPISQELAQQFQGCWGELKKVQARLNKCCQSLDQPSALQPLSKTELFTYVFPGHLTKPKVSSPDDGSHGEAL